MQDREKGPAASQIPLERQQAPQQVHPSQSSATQGYSSRYCHDLIDMFNSLIKDRGLEVEFRTVWNPTAVTFEGSAVVPVTEDDKGFYVADQIAARQNIHFDTDASCGHPRDLTALTAVRGEGARRLLGEAFDIGRIKHDKTDPALESVAVFEITESEMRIRKRGRLLLPLPA